MPEGALHLVRPDDDSEVEDQFEYGAPTMVGVKLEILEFSGMFEKAYFPQRAGEPLPALRGDA